MKIIFWGTRGSVPAPGRDTVVYGGNTPCVEVVFEDGTDVIVDAGTGIRELGNRLLTTGRKADAFLLFSHYHWDHIQGLPFFTPGYVKGNRVRVFGLPGPGDEVRKILSRQMEQPFFPASMDLTFPMVEFEDLPSGVINLGSGRVTYIRTNHPDPCLGYKFQENGRTFIYFTDNELFPPNAMQTPRSDIVAFCREADVLVHDAQFTRAELPTRAGWGHSSNVDAVDLANEAHVSELHLFHHDPARKDKSVEAMLNEARQHSISSGSRLKVNACVEGEELILR